MVTIQDRACNPGGGRYEDTGCKYHDDCLTCPFPDCIYEEGYSSSRLRKEYRYRLIQEESVKTDKTLVELSEMFGVSTRTIERAIGYKFDDH